MSMYHVICCYFDTANQDNWLCTRCLFITLPFNNISNDEIIATLNGLTEEAT